MNFISWTTRPTIINENTQKYISADLVEESIAKTLKPVMNKMKKLNIGLPYRDARLFFFKFLQDNYPEVVPAGFETRKPSAKDVNAIVGQIATEKPELLDTIGAGFEKYSAEKTASGLDRVSQFLNTAATLRQGKGVRPKKAEGYVRKDYSKLTAQEIADATTDAIAKKQEEFDAGDDVSDEKLLLRTAVGSVIAQLEKEDVSQEALDNVADAVAKIDSLAQFEKFLDYIADFEEYNVIRQYLVDTMDVIETNLEDMQAQKEDEEYEKGNVYDDVRQDPREVDPHMPDTEDAECRYSDEEDFDKEESDLNDDGEISEYEKKRGLAIAKAMEKERKRAGQAHSRAVADHYEDEEFSTSEYMSKAPVEKREEAEEVKMSQQQINQYLAVQERQRIQNLYAQQRRHTLGY